jgi:uncharacterized protein YkwD
MKKIIKAVFLVSAICGLYDLAIAQSAQMPVQVLVLINKHRKELGLDTLAMNTEIARAADKHSHNMASKKIPFGHEGFDSRMAGLRKQLKNADGWAENVAYGAETPEEVVDMWLHSPGHKKNIEGSYNLTGIGIVRGTDGQLYYTQIFFHTRR